MILFGGDAGVLSLNTSKNILLNNNFYSAEIQYNATNINDVKFNVEITIKNNEKKLFEVPLSSIVSGELSGNLYLKKEQTNLTRFSAISLYVNEILFNNISVDDNYNLNGILLLSGTLDNSFKDTEINNKVITANIGLAGNIIDNDNNTYICQIVPNIDNEMPTVNLQLSDKNISYMNNAIINSNGTLSYNNNFDICINPNSGTIPSSTTHYSFNGSIYNFPESNLYDNYKPLLSLENSSMINLSPQLINNGDIIDWTTAEHTKIIGEVNNQYINNINDNYKNDKNIILNISNNEDLNKVSDILNSLPKNLYKHDIYIFINKINRVDYNLSSALIIENFYNGKINIIGNNKPKLTSDKHTILSIHNIEEITIENIEFTINDKISGAISGATYSEFDGVVSSTLVTDNNINQFHMTLLSLDSVNSATVSNCTFDNKVARKIKNINLTIYENNVLAYATYSLVFNKFSNLILDNCSFKNSNIGVITYLNALTQYTGKTYIYFPGINTDYEFEYIKTNKVIYGQNITYTNKTNFKSIVNYSAGNSIVVMFPLSVVYMEYEIDTDTNIKYKQLSNSLLLSEPNLILGIAQVGSLFNHTHKGITSTSLDVDDLERYKQRLEQLRKFKYDTCIGMINPQYAGNLFECNDSKKSIGFQYLTNELENNVITYGQYTHKLNINGTNFDGQTIHQTPSGDAGNILVLDLGDSNSYPTGIVGEQFNNISAEPSAGYYNAGTFWHKYLNDKEVHYDLINVTLNVTSANTEAFIRNLCSRSTENLYLTQLLKYYFSTNQSFGSPLSALHEQTYVSAMPIGLWSHPSMYQLKFNDENPFDNQLIHDTTIRVSDRYNHAIRNKYWINGRSYDSYWGNANKVVKYPFAAGYLIGGRSYYFLS